MLYNDKMGWRMEVSGLQLFCKIICKVLVPQQHGKNLKTMLHDGSTCQSGMEEAI
jgi:hypothetical protein